MDNLKCEKCGLCKNRKHVVNGNGPKDARIFVIGEGPGLREDDLGQPFCGPSGLLLRKMMQQAGMDYRQVYFSNVVRCLPKSEDKKKQVRPPTYEEMEACSLYLEKEIAEIKPTIIVPAGSIALKYIMRSRIVNISKKRGLEIWSEDYKCKVMPIYHPAAVIRNPQYESVTVQDLIRISNAQFQKELTPLGLGNYTTVDNKEKIEQLFSFLETEPEISIDLETTNLNWQTEDIISIGFSWKERDGWCLPLLKSKLDPTEPTTRFWDDATYLKIIDRLKVVLALPSKKIFHNCFYATTPITLADGTTKTIHEIVTKKLQVEVPSYNIATQKIENKKVVGWSRFYDENTQWLKIVTNTTKKNKKGDSGLILTPDHRVYTDRGYIPTKEIIVGDNIFYYSTIDNHQYQMILGSLLGDSSLCIQEGVGAKNPYFKFAHGDKQREYFNYKKDVLKTLCKRSYCRENENRGFNKRKGALLLEGGTSCLPELKSIHAMLYTPRKSISTAYLNLLDARGIAFWYMDDGSLGRCDTVNLSTASFSKEENLTIIHYFKENWDIEFKLVTFTSPASEKTLFRLRANKDASSKFLKLVAPHIHKSLQYKLGKNYTAGQLLGERELVPFVSVVEKIEKFYGQPSLPTYDKYQYCMEVEDNHNFYARRLLVSNSKFDLKFLIAKGININNAYFDTMVAHHLIDENAEGLHGLKDLAWVFTDMGGYDKEVDDFFAANRKFKRQFIMLPFNVLTKYNAADADCTFRLFKKFEPLIQQQGLMRLYKQIVNPMRDVLLQAEIEGVQIDADYIEKLRQEYTTKKDSIEKIIVDTVGPINLNSSKELREVLYNKLKFKTSKLTKKGALSTDKEALSNLAKLYPHHIVPKNLLEYRDCTKLLSTFITGLSRHVDAHGRIHSTYKQHGTVTGRLASSEPNLQNVPRPKEGELLPIRGIFVAKPEHTLIEADYGQAEFRFWAVYSQDLQMIEDLKSKQDIHTMTAASAFGVPLAKVTRKQRQDAKAIVFGLMYGRGTWSISQQLGISEEEAERVVYTFFCRYPKAKAWLHNQVQLARRQGYVINYFGRIRRLPGIISSDDVIKSEAERQAKNAPIQSGAADMTSIASIRIKQRLEKEGLHAKLVLTVHDSLVYETPDSEVTTTTEIIKEETERPIGTMNVPMSVDLKQGNRWGFLKEVTLTV